MSEKWMMEKIPGYAALPRPDRDAITNFAFLRSLFEARSMEAEANAKQIAKAVDQWEADGALGAELYVRSRLAFMRFWSLRLRSKCLRTIPRRISSSRAAISVKPSSLAVPYENRVVPVSS